MGIEFELFKKNTTIKKVYEDLWFKTDFTTFGNARVVKTPISKDIESKNSYSFYADKSGKCEGLIDCFGIEKRNSDIFRRKYKMAVSGAGNEGKRITTLHSSSLCALLFFYNITEDNPLFLNLLTNKCNRRICFTKSSFEFKSIVLNGSSNMDVVLVGKDVFSGEKVILLLESKFSEYLTVGKSKDISNSYLKCEIFNKLIMDQKEKYGIKEVASKKEGYFKLESSSINESFYIDGIKQMVSHYIGAYNLMKGKYESKNKDNQRGVIDEIEKGTVFLLGEILFDYKISDIVQDNGDTYYGAYTRKYEIMAEEISKLSDELFKSGYDTSFEILKNNIGYSIFMNDGVHKVEPRIRYFYFGE